MHDEPGHLVGVRNVHRLPVLGHVSYDAFPPRHLHLVRVHGGQDRGARVHVEEFGHERLLVAGALHQEEGAPVGVDHDADEHQDLVAEARQVQVVGYVFDQLQEELPLVVLLQVVLEIHRGGRVLGDVDPGLEQRAQDVRGGRRQRAGFPQ